MPCVFEVMCGIFSQNFPSTIFHLIFTQLYFDKNRNEL